MKSSVYFLQETCDKTAARAVSQGSLTHGGNLPFSTRINSQTPMIAYCDWQRTERVLYPSHQFWPQPILFSWTAILKEQGRNVFCCSTWTHQPIWTVINVASLNLSNATVAHGRESVEENLVCCMSGKQNRTPCQYSAFPGVMLPCYNVCNAALWQYPFLKALYM